ncbi:hypothetical protein [Mycolicibacterium sarraceniae]|uniref:Uncharacterized protein n=1 Tax=Mycolicibacterium sarraceniae TaxID=1534348 RepID=A0A7I7STI5_9MYCO|nr:hypothetical protein [Mycolicibacterium sarraceniae]BBY59479.1 hypothetical protein MSAR_26150 [Mycolicibacterium sarraceniae]
MLHIHVPLATGAAVGPIGAMMEFARTIAKAIGWQAPGSSAAARSAAKPAAAQTLVAANEVPQSVVNSETPTLSVPIRPTKAARQPATKVDKGTRASAGSGSGQQRGHTSFDGSRFG